VVPGVLQDSQVVRPQGDRAQGQAGPGGQRLIKAHRLRQLKGRHQLFDLAHHMVDQSAFEPAQAVAHGAQHHMANGRLRQALLQCGGKIFDDENRLGAGIVELVLQLTRRVQGVDVNDHKAGPQNSRHRDRVLQYIGQHHSHPVPAGQTQGLQVSRQGQTLAIELGVAELFAHRGESNLVTVAPESFFKQAHQRPIGVNVNVCRHSDGISRQPRTICHETSGTT
jgi:hypothetical protein